MTELKRLKRRIAELEREVAELKMRPPQVFEYHYHQMPAPQPYYVPYYPWAPYWGQPTWIAHGAVTTGHGAVTNGSVTLTSCGNGVFIDGVGNAIQSTPTLTYGPQN